MHYSIGKLIAILVLFILFYLLISCNMTQSPNEIPRIIGTCDTPGEAIDLVIEDDYVVFS